jgi:hypothetical protein
VHVGWDGITTPMIELKRVYQESGPLDGMRILVDRLWPRSVEKKWRTSRNDARTWLPAIRFVDGSSTSRGNGLSSVSGIERNSAMETRWKNFIGLPVS